MPDVTKRILTDETGQDIVNAIEALANVVDPNGTTVAVAAKLNNMTTSITVLPAGSTPTSSLTEVNGHFHLTLGVPIELPTVTSTNNGEILKVENGAWTVGAAPTGVPDVTASDNGRILQVSNGEWTAQDALPTTMVGATSSAAGTAGLVPAPTIADAEKFFRGDGTWQDGGRPMVILSYGNSVWDDFIEAYTNNVIVYCRASSNANPASGSQTRMAFMAYVNNPTTPTEVEFQYYRSMSAHSASQMGDQVFVYKLSKTGGWSVTTREASIKSIAAESGSKIGVSWNNNAVTLSNTMTATDMPMSSSDATTVDSVINEQSTAIADLNTATNSFVSIGLQTYSTFQDGCEAFITAMGTNSHAIGNFGYGGFRYLVEGYKNSSSWASLSAFGYNGLSYKAWKENGTWHVQELATSVISEATITPEHSSVDSFQLRKVNGVTQLRLNTKSSSNIANGSKLGTIPSGYRPGPSLFGQVFTYSTGKPFNGSVWVDGNGNISYYGDAINVQAVMYLTYIAQQ